MSLVLLKGKTSAIFDHVTKWSLYLLFFLTPIFFLPWTSNILDINKQMLLVVLTVIGLVAWLGQMVLSKQFAFRSGWLNLVPGLFIVSVLASSILSVSGYQTWVGQASQEYISFLSTIMFVILFYLFMNTAGKTILQRNALFALLLSAALTGLVTFFGMFNLYHLPFDFAVSIGFNTIGTLNGFIVFMTTVMFVGLALWLVSQNGKDRVIPEGGVGTLMRVLILVVTVINIVSLVVIDYWVFWVINIIGVLLLASFGFIQDYEFPNPKKFAIPLVVLLVSVLFLFLPSPIKLSIPLVVSPSYGASWQITKSTLGVNTSQLLLGSGPGTFLYDYNAYKPVTVNLSRFWSMRFDRAKSSVLTTMASIGLIGTLLWFVLMIWVAVKSLSRLLLERDHEEWKMTYVMFVGWAILFISQILYSSNFTLHFLLWGFTGLLASQVVTKVWRTDFVKSPKLGLASSFAFVLVGVGVLASLFITGQRYTAEVAFAKAIRMDKAGESIDAVVNKLSVAVKYNGASDQYYRNLSSALLKQTREKMLSFAGAELTAEQTQEVSLLVNSAVNAGNKAVMIEPNYVANWSALGSVYRDLMNFARGAEEQAAKSYLNTIKLEPASPANRTDLGRVYLVVSDRARSLKNAEDKELAATATEQEKTLLTSAEQSFNAAIQLKNDYLPAHYYLAATYERQGRLQDATARMIALRNNSPSDIGLGFQLSQLLMRLKRYDLAKQELERIVTINPNYSNGLWYLASLYEIDKDRKKAIELVGKVVENNPDNEMAKDRLRRLQAGETTTVIPEPIQQNQGKATTADEGEVVEESVADKDEASEEETTE